MFHFFIQKPKNKTELVDFLRNLATEKMFDYNSLNMIEGILNVPALRVKEVMVPRSKMSTIKKEASLEDLLPFIIETAHSRFPVIGETVDDISGILLAKDLLSYAFKQQNRFNMRDILREAIFIPENKRLDTLLQEFRMRHNHMAIVVDEYGGVSGLITIEDVLEQIVGAIEDEYDYDLDDEEQIKQHSPNTYSIQALTPIATFNDYFQVQLHLDDIDTIGGYVTRHFNHLPKRGEIITIETFEFKILRANNRQIHALHVTCQEKNIPKKSTSPL
jgi:magnesium and cobalt transporter